MIARSVNAVEICRPELEVPAITQVDRRVQVTRSPRPGLLIDHLSQNRLCLNPEHLEETTIMGNLAASPGARQFRNRQIEAIAEQVTRVRRAFLRQRPIIADGLTVVTPDLMVVTGGRLGLVHAHNWT